MITSFEASPSVGSPNSVLPAYAAVPPAVATRVAREYAADVPSCAVARTIAVPAPSERSTPAASMLAMLGVSLLQMKVAGSTAFVVPERNVANSWSSKPTGSAGSELSRPVNEMVLGGGGGVTPKQ